MTEENNQTTENENAEPQEDNRTEEQKVMDNFLDLEQELQESKFKEDLSILREAWDTEIQKPGCTQCIKNASRQKYAHLGSNIIFQGLNIEQSKQIHDLTQELNKEHQEVAKKIQDQVQAEVDKMKEVN
tara:strand:- start:114 stop:500 length:387 start_codon:yes stop_codon:yes gene_type:complete